MSQQQQKQPQDRKQKQLTSKQRDEALDREVTFEFDGDIFAVTPRDATGLEFMEALEDEQLIKAVRLLLGREQASTLFKGRDIEQLETFFEVMGEAVDTGNQ